MSREQKKSKRSKRKKAIGEVMQKKTRLKGNSTVIKAAAIEREFFGLVDRLNDETLTDATPDLVKMLQRYDRLLGFPPSADFMTAIDVRMFYAMFGRFKEADPKTREKLMKAVHKEFAQGQVQAIDRARLTLVKGGTQELTPAALMPVFR